MLLGAIGHFLFISGFVVILIAGIYANFTIPFGSWLRGYPGKSEIKARNYNRMLVMAILLITVGGICWVISDRFLIS